MRRRLTYANVMATLALFFALTGGAWAATSKYLMASDAITQGDLAGSTYGNPVIASGKVTSAKIANGAVTSTQVGTDALTGANIDEKTLNLGLYGVASATDSDISTQKVATVYCPSGTIALSGGFEVLSSLGSLSGDPIAVNDVDVFGGGVTVAAIQTAPGTFTWKLVARALCATIAG